MGVNKNPKKYMLTSASFIRVLRGTTRILDSAEMVYLGQLISADEYFVNSKGKAIGDFYTTREFMEKVTGISPKVQRRCERNLVKSGLIKVTPQSYNANSYRINYPLIDKLDKEYALEFKRYIDQRNKRKEEDATGKYKLETEFARSLWEDRSESAQTDTLGVPNGYPGGADMEPSGLPFVEANNNKRIINRNKKKNNSNTTFIDDQANLDESNPSVLALNKKKVVPALNSPVVPANDLALGLSCIGTVHNSMANKSSKKLRTLVDIYNHSMKLDFNEDDMRVARSNEHIIRMVEKYINPIALPFIWNHVADEGTKRKVSEKRLAAFIGYGLPDKILDKQSLIKAYCNQELELKLDKVFRIYSTSVMEMLKDSGYRCDAMGNIDPVENGVFFPQKQQTLMKCEILKNGLLNELPREERHDIIAAMEAI